MKNGFNGISFPFRISGTGGVQMSSTDVLDVPHIVEAMEQILLTRPYERKMEYHFKSDLDTLILTLMTLVLGIWLLIKLNKHYHS